MAFDISIPRFMIAAPGSGSGKTLVTCAMLRILERMQLRAASFKCGPDFIDPMFHRSVLQVPSRNLDLFLAGEEGVRKALMRGGSGRDIAVLEGVMGLFDGMSFASDENSSYDIAVRTETPVILVVNCAGMGRSVIPLIRGFSDYGTSGTGKSGPIRGVILNNTSKAAFDSLRDEIFAETGARVLGFLPKLKGVELGSRHLGLILPNEIPDLQERIDRAADALAESLDVDSLLAIAGYRGAITARACRSAPRSQPGPAGRPCDHSPGLPVGPVITARACGRTGPKAVRIAIALDEAFCFYYEDNLDLLREMGAELITFSPLHDNDLPDASGIILGGGYPELYAHELSSNHSMLRSIREAADRGVPILAECGGFLYLNRTLKTPGGETYDMAGVLGADSHMTERLTHFGYVNVEAARDTRFLKKGENIRGHEFHYYDTTDNGRACEIKKPRGNRSWTGYVSKESVFAGFAHLYYPSAPEFVERFLAAASAYTSLKET